MKVTINNIMCATDFSEYSNRAIPFGVSLSNEFNSKLFICHVIDLPSTTMYGEFFVDPTEIQTRIEEYAASELANLIGDDRVQWEPFISVGHPADEIARIAESNNVDIVITTTHGRSGLKRLILGSVTERLIHTLHCPVLVVQDPKPGNHNYANFKKILVGCDFSPDSDLAVSYAISLAQEFESEINLVHVIEPDMFDDLVKLDSEDGRIIKQERKDKISENLAGLIPREACEWCYPKIALLAGRPHEELSKYAIINDIDLIVLGVHGKGFVEKLFVGSTTDRVIRVGACPVLVVKPFQP